MRKKIGDLTKIRTGKLDANVSSENGKYPFFTCSREPLKISTYSYDCECVLVAGNGDLNVKYYNGKFDAYQRTYIIEDNGSGKLYMPYLYYFMEGYIDELRKQAIGGVIKYIKLGNLTDALIRLPSIDEQKLIVDILKKVKHILDMHKKEIEYLDNLIKARFVEMFGDPYVNPLKWKKLKIKDAVTIEPQNGLYKPQSDYVTDGTGIPILRIDGFYDGMVTDFASLKRLKCSETERQRYLLLEDDIVINRVNSIEYLGKCAHIKELLEDTVYESNMMRMHFDPEYYNPVYICKLLCSQFIYDQIVNHAKKSVNQASINQKDVLDFNIYQPPLDLQNEFADFVHQVDKSKVAVQKALDETQKLFDSLMQQYFG